MFSITNLMSKVSSFLSSANSLSNQIDNRIKKLTYFIRKYPASISF